MTRGAVAGLVMAAAAALVALDLGASEALNPYRAPALFALGSGQAAGGAHCAAFTPN